VHFGECRQLMSTGIWLRTFKQNQSMVSSL
jgi:hypothetical protein